MLKKSKISEALKMSIDSGKNNASPTEVIDVVHNNEEAGAENCDAFQRAVENAPEQLEAAVNDDSNSQTAKEEGIPEKPVPIQKRKNTKSAKARRPGNYLASTALLVSIGAICVAGYASFGQSGIRAHVDQSLASIEEAVGGLTQRSDNQASQISQVQRASKSNTEKFASFGNLKADFVTLNAALNDIREQIVNTMTEMDLNSTDIKTIKQDVAELRDQLSKQKTRPVAKKRTLAKKLKPKPVVVDKTRIEGSSLASLDTWGTQPYAVLRDEEGNWIPLTKGDYYKGWRFAGVSGDKAVFKKSGKVREIIIEE